MTDCNLCQLNAIKRKHKQSGMRVMVRKSERKTDSLGGFDIFVMPRGISLPYTDIPVEYHENYWVCWFMSIPERCAC